MSSILNATTTTGLAISPDNSGSLQLATNNGTTAVTIDTSQNVGIGTSSPSSYANQTTLTVNGTTYGRVDLANGGTVRGYLYGGSAGITLETGGALPVAFATSGTERMRITSSGNVLVGTTSFVYTAAGTQVNGGQINIGSAGTGGSTLMNFGNGNGAVGSITVTGSSTSYNINSDYRLKENIAPMTGALATVAQLKPVTYKWKADGSDGQGFIAHELQAVVPDCVTGEKDAVETYTDEDGNEQTRPKYQGIDTSFLVATLTAALQEAHGLIKDLQARVETLEAK